MLPLLLDLRGKRVIIFGGGRVALRKARLLAPQAKVTVVSPDFLRGFEGLPVELVRRRVRSPGGYLRGASLAVAATDDARLNEAVALEARRRGVWVDRADGVGDVIVPSVIRRGDITVAIATGGRAPVLSRHLRERLERVVGPEVATMAELLGAVRRRLKATVESQGEREALLRSMVEDRTIWALLRAGRVAEARRRMDRIIKRKISSQA